MQSAQASMWFCISPAPALMAVPGQSLGSSKAKVPGGFGGISLTNARRRSKHSRRSALFSDSSQVSCIMADKQTGLINRPDIATFLLFLVALLLACSKGKERPSVSVPADCQQFLDKYFDAW